MKKIAFIFSLLIVSGSIFGQLDRSKRPASGPAKEVNIGKIESFTMDNGLKVFVVENHKLSRINFSLMYDHDPVQEKNKAGAQGIMGDLMGTGTTTRSKDELDASLDFIGANLRTSSGGVFGSCLTKHQKKFFELASDVVVNPLFKQEEFDKLMKQAKSGLQTEKNDPDAMAGNLRKALLYGKDHPYGEIMTDQTLDNVTLEDCKNHYNAYIKPNISYVALVGDINLQEAKKLMNNFFGSWKKAEVPSHSYTSPTAPVTNKLAFINKKEAVQSVIGVGYPLEITPSSEDAIQATMLNTIFGGGFISRLNQNLREANGFTYGARSSIEKDELIGKFSLSAKVRNEVTDSALTEVMKELKKMYNEGITQEELDITKKFLTGNFAISLEDARTVARFAINIDRYNLPKDYYTNYLKNLNAVTVEEINAAAKKYIKPNNAYIMVVGNKKEVFDKVRKFSKEAPVEYDNYGNVYTEKKLRLTPAGLTPSIVIQQYIKARGGEKKLKAVKSIKMNMSASVQGKDISIETKRSDLNKYAVKVSMGPMTLQEIRFDGEKGGESGMAGKKTYEEDKIAEMKEESVIMIETKYKELGYALKLLGIEEIDGRDVNVIEVISPSGKSQLDYYDTVSGLKVKQVEVNNTEQGQITLTMMFDDYREVKGIKFPHKVTQDQNGQVLEMTVTSIEVNPKLKADEFTF